MKDEQNKKDDKKSSPNEVGKIKVSDMLRITDAKTKEVIVEKKQ
jgi:hypothetical protein